MCRRLDWCGVVGVFSLKSYTIQSERLKIILERCALNNSSLDELMGFQVRGS